MRSYIKQYAIQEISHNTADSILRSLISIKFNLDQDKAYLLTKLPDYVQVLTRQRTNQKLSRALAVRSNRFYNNLKIFKVHFHFNSQIDRQAESNRRIKDWR